MTIVNMVGGGGTSKTPSNMAIIGRGVDIIKGTSTLTYSGASSISYCYSWTPTGYTPNQPVYNRPIYGYVDSDGNVLSSINAQYTSYKASTSYCYTYSSFSGNITIPSGAKGTAVYDVRNVDVLVTLVPSLLPSSDVTAKNIWGIVSCLGDVKTVRAHINESGNLIVDEDVTLNVTHVYKEDGSGTNRGAVVVGFTVL